MFDDPAYRTRVDEMLAHFGELEALTAIVRKLNEPLRSGVAPPAPESGSISSLLRLTFPPD